MYLYCKDLSNRGLVEVRSSNWNHYYFIADVSDFIMPFSGQQNCRLPCLKIFSKGIYICTIPQYYEQWFGLSHIVNLDTSHSKNVLF